MKRHGCRVASKAAYADALQPYGELFVMRYDGTKVETDNQWEDGTPAFRPTARPSSSQQPR
jgi:hypothetical protein